MTKQYVWNIEDVCSLVTADLPHDDVDFMKITEIIEQYGHEYVMIDFIETAVTFGMDEMEQSFQVIKFLSGEYLIIVCNGEDLESHRVTVASEVIEHLQQFLDATTRITLEQGEQLDLLIEKLIK